MRASSLMVSLVLCGGCAAASPPGVLLIGEPELTAEFRRNFEHFGVAVDEAAAPDVLATKDLDRYDAVAICAPMTPEPLALSAEAARALLDFVERGGRAYVEYVRFPEDTLPGWTAAPEPVLERFERLAVMQDNLLGTELKKDDLLEEHNTYLIDLTPPAEADVLLKYGLFMGTYAVDWEIQDLPAFFVITVDLGSEIALKSAEQWYGGLDRNYVPDVVRVSLAGDDRQFAPAGEMGMDGLVDLKAAIPLEGRRARYVQLYVEKQATSRAGGDFIVLGGIEIYDTTGRNVALHRPYTLQVKNGAPQAVDAGGPLTRGEKPVAWSQDRSHLYPAPPKRGLNEYRWNGLVSAAHGEGRLYYAATSLSTFRRHNYRLTRRWEDLLRGLAVELLPEDRRDAARERWLPLEASTHPRRWSLPGDPIEVRVKTEPGAAVRVEAAGLSFDSVEEVEPGRYVARCAAPPEGDYRIAVRVERGRGRNETAQTHSVRPREYMYRRALDRNMAWFLASGTMPQPDGSEGIKSTLEIGALYAGKAEDLPSAFRADCQAMVGKAFHLYGDLTGEAAWLERAENLARWLMECQLTDPAKPTYGAFKWMPTGNDAIYPQDDNNRNAEFLAWLYTRTGKAEYLESALAAVEFARDTAREDGTLSYWVTTPDTVNAQGRFALRTANGFSNVTDWCLYRNHYAYRATGDALYLDSIRDLIRIYGSATATPGALAHLPSGGQYQGLGERGLSIAIHYLEPSTPLRQQLIDRYRAECKAYLARPDVQRYGYLIQPGDMNEAEIGYAYNNDCSIHTRAGEPLTDQLYTTTSAALRRWEAYKAAPSDVARAALESVLDYLVRIQFENPDPRLDGCWFRSYDMEHGEYYGTRYDPNYGAYHAYTGWMNSMAATALAYYLLDENPLEAPTERHGEARKVVEAVRKTAAPEYLRERNLLEGVALDVHPAPDRGSRTAATLTDGVIEGHHGDGLSAGWTVPEEGEDFAVTLTADLGREVACRRLTVRTGGLDDRCFADRLVLEAGPTPDALRPVLDVPLASADGMNGFEFDEQSLRHLRITVRKRPNGHPLYLGEIRLLALDEVVR